MLQRESSGVYTAVEAIDGPSITHFVPGPEPKGCGCGLRVVRSIDPSATCATKRSLKQCQDVKAPPQWHWDEGLGPSTDLH